MNRPPIFRFAQMLLATFLFIQAVIAQETQHFYLSGHGKDDAVPWNFLCTAGVQSGFWTNLPVPSNWELHGFGTLNYKKDGSNPPPESGLYERDFVAPENWSVQRIFLVFDGVMTDTSAKLNGQSVGETHQGGFYRFRYEVTSLMKFDATNKLEVTVAKHSANNSVNRAERLADYWVFGGIYRPVYLEAVPQQFIERVAINAKADGSFSAQVSLNGITDANEVEAQIQTLEGKNIGEPFHPSLSSGIGDRNHGGVSKTVDFKSRIESPKLWTAETPNLYQVKVRLKQEGKIIHEISQRFGFRTFEVRDGDGLYLNGQKIILKGVCRHSFWPDSGRCLSEAVHRLDIQSIKDMNGNAVRMSHYPPDAEFLDLCDELGLYVLDELTGWHNFYDTPTGTKLVKEVVTRDVNHPSILFWDNGNEGGFNTNLDKVFGEFDPQQRRVLHPWAAFNGLCTMHYLAYDKAEIAAGGKAVFFKPPDKELVATNDLTKYIYMPTEFSHGLFDGGAGAGLEDYWRMMMSHTNCAGGFIWAWTDDGLKRPDTGDIDTAANQAPDGIVGPYRQREGSFYSIKKIWSPFEITKSSIHSSSATFTLKNKFAFLNASDCKFSAEFQWFSSPLHSEIIARTNLLVLLNSPAIQPGQTGKIKVNFPEFRRQPSALALIVQDANGREISRYVWPIKDESMLPRRTKILQRAKNLNGLQSIHLGALSVLTNGPRAANTNVSLKNVSWQLLNDGWVRCQFKYTATGTNDFIGVVFDLPKEIVKIKSWVGDGPYRVWKNRLAGPLYGQWENDYNNTITGWRDWIYPEFKGVFSNVRWLQLKTTERNITVVPENIPFVQVLTPELPPTNLVGQAFANLPQCGLGFLHAIPPIGSKFKRADQGGPQSQPNVVNGKYSGSVSFYFSK